MPAGQPSASLSFDIFCRIVDNYGDIGVCWRLARQLAQPPFGVPVRLWVDDLNVFSRIEPGIRSTVPAQRLAGVDIVHWTASAPGLPPHRVVIEAFACDPPAAFITALKDSDALWINLEYLSAEAWVADFHLVPSVQADGTRKFFFFPGFTPDTGGLLREPDLLAQRDAWQSVPERRQIFLQSLGVPGADLRRVVEGAMVVFLFPYDNAPLRALMQALAHQPRDVTVLVPEGVAADTHAPTSSSVRVLRIPFVPQSDFDQLLWSADLNIVRGEDSLVRALWAGKPMIWQPYVQEDSAHLKKLDAWLALSRLDPGTQALIRSWTQGDSATLQNQLVEHCLPAKFARWQREASEWSKTLAKNKDLASSLVEFCARNTGTG